MSEEARRRDPESTGGITVGAAAIVERISGALEDVVTIHHGHTPEITLITATEATGIWAMEDMVRWQQPTSPVAELHGFGHYHDTYERSDGQWHIKTTRLARLCVDVTKR